ncbi:MATE family efflux transporter [Enterococcus sp. AZ109]|uniref:MATE family efflux transporter n=1 Tax=Enterococcus sp. AZ109 TaxID=2774634 RepID=UPI003F1EF5A7
MDATEEKMENQEDRELGTKKILPLFAKYSILTLIGMLAQAIMVILEGLVIGRGLGEAGLASVGIIMPLEYLMLALGGFFAIGISTICAMRLGDGDEEGARKAYGQGLWFSLISSVVIAVVIFLFAGNVATLLGATPELHGDIVLFIRLFMFGYPFCIVGHVVVYIARVDEKPSIATWAMTISAICAIIWLYISVFILKLGIAGAAVYYASSIGIWGLFLVYFVVSPKTIFKFHLSDLKFDTKLLVDISKIGFPFMLVQASSTIFTIVLNNFLGSYGGELDIAAFAVINSYIIYILMLITQAATGGQQPIASYNYGAKKLKRVIELIKVSFAANVIGIYLLAAIAFLFSEQLVSFFVGSGSELIPLAGKYTKVVVSFAALGLSANLMSAYFQAVERIPESTILGICRYIVFGVPAIFIMANVLGVTGVWYSQPVSDILTFALTLFLTYREINRLKKMDSELI